MATALHIQGQEEGCIQPVAAEKLPVEFRMEAALSAAEIGKPVKVAAAKGKCIEPVEVVVVINEDKQVVDVILGVVEVAIRNCEKVVVGRMLEQAEVAAETGHSRVALEWVRVAPEKVVQGKNVVAKDVSPVMEVKVSQVMEVKVFQVTEEKVVVKVLKVLEVCELVKVLRVMEVYELVVL